MKREFKVPVRTRRFENENDWDGERERRKQNWTEQERSWRKERRKLEMRDESDALAILIDGGFPS
ncbi:MAG: hypothetical protein ACHQ49_07490 [Elusimicrobiota bacterium]